MISEFNGNIVDGVYYFYSGWSGKCQYVNDRINRIASKYPQLNIIKINTAKHIELKKKYLVNRIPTFIYIKEGKIVKRLEGNVDYITLGNWVEGL